MNINNGVMDPIIVLGSFTEISELPKILVLSNIKYFSKGGCSRSTQNFPVRNS